MFQIRSRYIKKKIFRSNVFICMCFACLVLAVFSSTFFVHVINSSYDRYSLESELIKSNVESCIARHISLMDNIIQDKDIVNYNLDRKKFTQIEYTTFVRLKIQNLIEGCSNIRAAAFVNTAGEIVSVKNKLVESDFTTDEIKYNESVESGNTKDGSIFWYYRDDIDSIVLLRRVRDYDSEIGISEHGYFIIYLDNDLFDMYGEKTNENLEIYMLNADETVISSNNYKSRGEVFDGIEKGYMFFKKNIREAQLSVVCRVNTTVVNRTLYLIAFIVILFFFLTLIMIIIINRHYLDKLFLPITQMIAFCEDIKKGSYANLQIESEYEEVSCLASTLNSMSVKLNELINKNLILKVNEANAKLEFYKMQMNPHFLFNTFSMMKTMSELEMNDELQKVISCVITISRYALKNEIEVLFGDEIKCAFDYAEIIKLRYASVFINFDIAEELYKCKIPKFIIQPLLENSVKHGIDNVLRNGDIKIVAFIQNNDVIVQVTDNGIGIKEEKLKSLNDVLLSKIKGSRVDDKIGLRNINERLKLLYGENYGITLNSEYDVYTCVTVKIPKIIYLPEEDENV